MNSDKVPLFISLLTVGVSVWSLIVSFRSARHQRYGAFVTAERLKWLQELREATSRFCGAVATWRRISFVPAVTPEIQADLLKTIDEQQHRVRLMLDARFPADVEIDRQVVAIAQWVQATPAPNLDAALAELVKSVQEHTNTEWAKVKVEAVRGAWR